MTETSRSTYYSLWHVLSRIDLIAWRTVLQKMDAPICTELVDVTHIASNHAMLSVLVSVDRTEGKGLLIAAPGRSH